MKHSRLVQFRSGTRGWAPSALLPGNVGAGWRARLRYHFDSQLSKGAWVLIAWLSAAALSLVLVGALVVTVFGLGINNGQSVGFAEAFWQNLLRLLDTGTLAGDNGWFLRLVSLVMTVSGIFVATSLIGLMATSLDQRIAGLRRGRSAVIEQGHMLVLGWSTRVYALVAELVVANQNQRGRVVVVLASEDKTAMEDRLRAAIPSFGTTKVVCRTGDPASPHDLQLVNVGRARSIIVLAGEGSGDASAIKAVLAVMTSHTEAQQVPIVVEMLDEHSARALAAAADENILTVQPDDVIAKVTAQACHQPGMGVVLRELLDFEGDEIYFAPAPDLVGHTFAEALLAYENSTVIGRSRAGTIELNPAMDSVFGPDDGVIVVSADDDTVLFTGFREVQAWSGQGDEGTPASSERMLIVGWSALGARILRELDGLLSERTPIDVLVDDVLVGTRAIAEPVCSNLEVAFHRSDDEPALLRKLLSAAAYEHVIVLAYRDGLSLAEADARTMLNLLTLRRSRQETLAGPRVVAEVVDSRNVALAETAGADDLVVSDRLASLMIAQIAEHPDVRMVLDELFAPGGASIELRPAPANLGACAWEVAVATVATSGAVAMGYRLGTCEVVLNPAKSAKVTFSPGDHLVVLVSTPGDASVGTETTGQPFAG